MTEANNCVYIIGAGAIGKALAVCLKSSGKNAVLVRASIEKDVTVVKTLRLEMANGSFKEAEVEVTTLDKLPALDGIVVLANKSFGNKDLAVRLKNKIGNSSVVIMQNGLAVEQPFLNADFPTVYRCILMVTSQILDNGTIRFKPVGPCEVGQVKGAAQDDDRILNTLSTPWFEFKYQPDIQPVIWKKAIINCIFNSICPLLDIDNGIFYRDNTALKLARQMMTECLEIARLNAINLHIDTVERTLLQISKSSDGQLISTLQDIHHGRRTEIDTLNFAIVAMAESLGKPDLVPLTRSLGILTKMKSALNLQ